MTAGNTSHDVVGGTVPGDTAVCIQGDGYLGSALQKLF